MMKAIRIEQRGDGSFYVTSYAGKEFRFLFAGDSLMILIPKYGAPIPQNIEQAVDDLSWLFDFSSIEVERE